MEFSIFTIFYTTASISKYSPIFLCWIPISFFLLKLSTTDNDSRTDSFASASMAPVVFLHCVRAKDGLSRKRTSIFDRAASLAGSSCAVSTVLSGTEMLARVTSLCNGDACRCCGLLQEVKRRDIMDDIKANHEYNRTNHIEV